MAQVKRIQCRLCTWAEIVNGEPKSKIAAREHREKTGHRAFFYAQVSEVKV